MDKILQAGLSSGMSATDGIHKGTENAKPNPVRYTHPEFDGLAHVIPENDFPSASKLVTYQGKYLNVQAPPLCIGAWPWGDKATFHYNPPEFPAIQQAWQECLGKGVNFIDTAQAYGDGESERICGRLFKGMRRQDFVIQTKYYVVPQLTDILQPKTAPLKKLQESLERLGVDSVDIYLVHGPIHI
jgi:hypothetical protein